MKNRRLALVKTALSDGLQRQRHLRPPGLAPRTALLRVDQLLRLLRCMLPMRAAGAALQTRRRGDAGFASSQQLARSPTSPSFAVSNAPRHILGVLARAPPASPTICPPRRLVNSRAHDDVRVLTALPVDLFHHARFTLSHGHVRAARQAHQHRVRLRQHLPVFQEPNGCAMIFPPPRVRPVFTAGLSPSPAANSPRATAAQHRAQVPVEITTLINPVCVTSSARCPARPAPAARSLVILNASFTLVFSSISAGHTFWFGMQMTPSAAFFNSRNPSCACRCRRESLQKSNGSVTIPSASAPVSRASFATTGSRARARPAAQSRHHADNVRAGAQGPHFFHVLLRRRPAHLRIAARAESARQLLAQSNLVRQRQLRQRLDISVHGGESLRR